MTDQFQPRPDGAATWRPKPIVRIGNAHVIGDPIVGASGMSRVKLDRASFRPPVAAGPNGAEPVVLPNGGSSHIAEAGFRAATPIEANNFAEISVFDGLNPVGIPGENGGIE